MKLGGRLAVLVTLAASALPGVAAAQDFNFGAAVAASGREAFVGQPANRYAPGMVYVYRPDAKGAWREALRLTAPDSAPHDGFGRSLAADGSTLLVGAGAGEGAAGAVYAFRRDRAGRWRESGRLTADDLRPGDEFGATLALRGDLAVVAATGRDSARGAVYVMRRSGEGWSRDTVLQPSGLPAGARFGAALVLDGELLAVGVPGADSARGLAYLYRRDASGAWAEETRLTGTGLTPNTRFGSAIAPLGRQVLIGAPGADRASGVVYSFERDSATGQWRPGTRLLPFDAASGARFGSAVAVVGREVWVGAPGASEFAGRVYRLSRDTAGVWTAATKIGWDSAGAQAGFGFNLAAAGDVVVVGMPAADFGEGRAALVARERTGAWRLRRTVLGEVFGPQAVLGRRVDCTDGKATLFACRQVDLLAFLPVGDLGASRGIMLNDIWGWTDPETGREYALVGRMDGTAFVDVTDPQRPRYLGQLPKTATSPASVWRDIKVYKNHAYVVADGARNHGMQVFDLTRLRDVRRPPVTFTPDAVYDRINSAHNIVVDTATGFAYAVGASSGGETCGGGLHMIDVREPKRPIFAGCFADVSTGRAGTGYTHDAQCVVYRGPDERYRGREICLGANETALSIADVTDKANPQVIGRASYPNVGYSHQGWLSEDQRYFYMDDELDELQGKVSGTRTIIWDLARLDDPVVAGEYIAPVRASDHNLYVKGDLMYESNYLSGLRVLDISDRTNPKEVGYFDTVPVGEDEPGFGGSWSNYPFFKSGTIVFTSMKEGLFLVRNRETPAIP